jgi:hypothetical protein
MSLGAMMWRAKLGTFCRMLNLNSDNYKAFLKEWFGRNWVYHLRPLIQAIKLPEFYSANESSESLKSVWLTAINERERLNPRRRPKPPNVRTERRGRPSASALATDVARPR